MFQTQVTPVIQVLIRHGDPLLRAGLKATLNEAADIELIDDAGPGPDVVVADYESGLEFVATGLQRQARVARVLIVTPRDSEREIRHALQRGVLGYITIGCCQRELLDGVRSVGHGVRHISARAAQRLADSVAGTVPTEREIDVMRLLVQGHCNKAIAARLDIALGTVKSHLKSIFNKLDANSRTEVAAVADKRGLLVPLPDVPLRDVPLPDVPLPDVPLRLAA